MSLAIFKNKFMHTRTDGDRRFVFRENNDTCWVRISFAVLSPQILPVEAGFSISQKSMSKAAMANTVHVIRGLNG